MPRNSIEQARRDRNAALIDVMILAASADGQLRPVEVQTMIQRVIERPEFEGIEASRRMLDKGTEAQQPQSNSHPRYALSSELAGNLNTYVVETVSNLAAGRCQNVTSPEAGTDAAK